MIEQYFDNDVNGSICLVSLQGQSHQATRVLRLRWFLREIERQATIYSSALSDAMIAGLSNQTDEAFREIQSALFAAIVVDRIIFDRNGTPRSKRRVREIQQLLEISDASMPAGCTLRLIRGVRNSFEHVDDRLDEAAGWPDTASVSDWYLADGTITGIAPSRGTAMRAFDPRAGLLLYNDQVLDLLALDLEMLRLIHNVRAAKADLKSEFQGRALFAPGHVNYISTPRGRPHLDRWQAARRDLIAAMPSDPDDPRATD